MAHITVIGLTETLSSLAQSNPEYWAAPALNDGIRNYRKELPKKIKQKYATRLSITAIERLMYTHRATKSNLKATLHINYQPHPLAHFQVKQTALTTGGRRKRVTSTKRGLGFRKRLTTQHATSTLVRVRRDRGYKLVRGKLGFKGWLQDKNGHIFERQQQPTWKGKVRLPFKPLYGPSVSQMARSRIVQSTNVEEEALLKVEKSAFDQLDRIWKA